MNRITPKFSRLADYAEYVIFSPIFMLNYKKKIKEQNKNYVIVPVYSIHPSRKQKTINQKYSLRVLSAYECSELARSTRDWRIYRL